SEKSEEGEKIRQDQIHCLFNELLDIKDIPVILCCDLNANPEKNKNGYNPLCYEQLTEGGFESVYVRGDSKEPAFTTFKRREHGVDKHTIDYIFLKNVTCNVTHLLDIPEVGDDESNSKNFIPNWNYPSDHFAIGCKLQWKRSLPFFIYMYTYVYMHILCVLFII
ncbi:CCR4-NOT transcription complex, subunit 6-like protein, partial [Reticulomyxa filosa]